MAETFSSSHSSPFLSFQVLKFNFKAPQVLQDPSRAFKLLKSSQVSSSPFKSLVNPQVLLSHLHLLIVSTLTKTPGSVCIRVRLSVQHTQWPSTSITKGSVCLKSEILHQQTQQPSTKSDLGSVHPKSEAYIPTNSQPSTRV